MLRITKHGSGIRLLSVTRIPAIFDEQPRIPCMLECGPVVAPITRAPGVAMIEHYKLRRCAVLKEVPARPRLIDVGSISKPGTILEWYFVRKIQESILAQDEQRTIHHVGNEHYANNHQPDRSDAEIRKDTHC